MSEDKIRIGITQGDTNGIGWEVVLGAFADPRMTELCTPVIYGSPEAAEFYAATLCGEEAPALAKVASADEARRGRVNMVPVGERLTVEPGRATPESAAAALAALRRATDDFKARRIDALVTAPINKEAMQGDGFRFTGHTEFLAAELEGEPMMIMCSDRLRVGLVTIHLPVTEVSAHITREGIGRALDTLRASLRRDFGVVEPRIAVLALNPHAGDGGLLGREEQEIIRPAIVEAYEAGVLAFGPFAADGLFAGGGYARYDGILAMYHDQGLAPFKALAMDEGVNYTAGLPVIRTSPAHGTAYDIAGKGIASEDSFRQAIYVAIDVFRNRQREKEAHANPLRKQYYEKRDDSDKLKLDSVEEDL